MVQHIKYGFKKGESYWKDKHLTEGHKNKISIAKRKKRLSPFTKKHKENLSESKKGINNPMFGRYGKNHPRWKKQHTLDSIRIMSDAKKGKPSPNKDKHLWQNKPHPMLGKHHSNESKIKNSKTNQIKQAGSNNSNWIDGRSFLPYCQKFNEKLKKSIRDRDNHICQLCSFKENGCKLSVHHIHYDKQNCHPDLITLCTSCNAKANGNRKYYESLFMNNLNNRGLLLWTKKITG